MDWNKIATQQDLELIKEKSLQKPQLIFKHSTRCAISSMALSRLERAWSSGNTSSVDANYLDLIAHRDLSSEIGYSYNITHESPQVLLIKNGKCVYDASHSMISLAEILKNI